MLQSTFTWSFTFQTFKLHHNVYSSTSTLLHGCGKMQPKHANSNIQGHKALPNKAVFVQHINLIMMLHNRCKFNKSHQFNIGEAITLEAVLDRSTSSCTFVKISFKLLNRLHLGSTCKQMQMSVSKLFRLCLHNSTALHALYNV